MHSTIAVDIDDTLNNFSETLRALPVEFDGSYGLPRERFDDYLRRVRLGERDPSELLATEYSFFKYKIHQQCFEAARPCDGAAAYMHWLREAGWRIVICTRRDLRRANECTRRWLDSHGIPYDQLFMAWNKIVFCRAWGIGRLVDDDPFNIAHGRAHGVEVFYPVSDRNPSGAHGARGFSSFKELRQWTEG